MKDSKRNQQRQLAKAEKYGGKMPATSKYAAKRRGEAQSETALLAAYRKAHPEPLQTFLDADYAELEVRAAAEFLNSTDGVEAPGADQ